MQGDTKNIVKPVILCGGSGTRLWPLSTPKRPKQFLNLLSQKSMVEMTLDRVSGQDGCMDFIAPLAVGSVKHKNLLKKTLPEAKLILEPFGRNSAPAIAAACLASETDDVLLILSADHNIENLHAFRSAIETAFETAKEGSIVTFGIHPTYPATGYGYIKARDAGASTSKVDCFVEKPDADRAASYLKTGGYFWNAGIFMFKASSMLDALETHEPGMVDAVRACFEPCETGDIALSGDAFARVKDISIDFAVMERANDIVVVPVDMGWSDVGGYKAIHDLLSPHEDDNVCRGPVFERATEGSYIRSDGPRILVSGVQDLAIVATDQAVMIAPKSDDAAVKALGQAFKRKQDLLNVPDAVCQHASEFLKDTFEIWTDKAWDPALGGFVEQLSLDGMPDAGADRRLRVQARQIFSYSKAAENGWVDPEQAKSIVLSGMDYLKSKGRHADGGWVHRLSANGDVIDSTRDFYDHAFVVLAGCACWNAFKLHEAKSMAEETLAFLNERLFDTENGGWFDALPLPNYRRANPHMHLLEAALEFSNSIGGSIGMETADQIVQLFETKLFRNGPDELVEMFDTDWTPHGDPGQAEIEPGHHYEWATLLTLHERMADHDTLSWQRRLIRRADAVGIDPRDGLAYNAVTAGGDIRNGRKRLWPQLEMLRIRLLHPTLSDDETTAELYERIHSTYIKPMPKGMWIDEIDEDRTAYSKAVPASMLYHFATSFGMLAAA